MTNRMVSPGETENSIPLLLEFAAENDVEGFKRSVCDESEVKEIGLWYGRHGVSKKMVFERRTPLMVAAKYGSVDIVKLIVSLPEIDVNFSCGLDKSTALHCAASGGSVNAIDVVSLLLQAGADPNAMDNNGRRPIDVVFAPLNSPFLKLALEDLLQIDGSVRQRDAQVSGNSLRSSSPPLSSSTSEGSSSAILGSILSVAKPRKEYPVDPSLPDIKNSIYASDEFRMYSFKVRPCIRAYSHDWTECPFVHPGENARRRDPRKFHYSCVPCPDHRKGICKSGDLCEYSHGIFECWLHPSQYRTRLCNEGTTCARRVCFFAHTPAELRTLNASTGAVVDYAAALNLLPSSPFEVSAMPASPLNTTASRSTIDLQLSTSWSQQHMPKFHIPRNNLASLLNITTNASDILSEEFNEVQDIEFQRQQLLNDLSLLSEPPHSISSTQVAAPLKTLNPSNLDKLLCAMVSSPRYTDQLGAAFVSPSYKSAIFNQFLQQRSILSQIHSDLFSLKNADHPYSQVPFGSTSLVRMSPRLNQPVSPISSLQSSLFHREKLQQQELCSQISRELGSKISHDYGSLCANSWPTREPTNGNVHGTVRKDELGWLHTSSTSDDYGEEPDVSWVSRRLKESQFDAKEIGDIPVLTTVEGSSSNALNESGDRVALQTRREGLLRDQIAA